MTRSKRWCLQWLLTIKCRSLLYPVVLQYKGCCTFCKVIERGVELCSSCVVAWSEISFIFFWNIKSKVSHILKTVFLWLSRDRRILKCSPAFGQCSHVCLFVCPMNFVAKMAVNWPKIEVNGKLKYDDANQKKHRQIFYFSLLMFNLKVQVAREPIVKFWLRHIACGTQLLFEKITYFTNTKKLNYIVKDHWSEIFSTRNLSVTDWESYQWKKTCFELFFFFKDHVKIKVWWNSFGGSFFESSFFRKNTRICHF